MHHSSCVPHAVIRGDQSEAKRTIMVLLGPRHTQRKRTVFNRHLFSLQGNYCTCVLLIRQAKTPFLYYPYNKPWIYTQDIEVAEGINRNLSIATLKPLELSRQSQDCPYILRTLAPNLLRIFEVGTSVIHVFSTDEL